MKKRNSVIIAIAVLIVVSIACSGCTTISGISFTKPDTWGEISDPIIGTWSCDSPLANFKVTFFTDHTVKISGKVDLFGVNGSIDRGKWTKDGKNYYYWGHKIDGTDSTEPMLFVLSDDNETLKMKVSLGEYNFYKD